jgi:hypothetical protein
LIAVAAHERIVLLARRPDLLRRLWPNERQIAELVKLAFELLASRKPANPTPKELDDFLTNVVALLRRPADVISLIRGLGHEAERAALMERVVSSPLVEPDLVTALVADRRLFDELPREGGWVGHAIFRRGGILLEDDPTRAFDIDELLPLGVEADRASSRALIGAAFDENRLTASSVSRLLELFPNDSYFAHKLNR